MLNSPSVFHLHHHKRIHLQKRPEREKESLKEPVIRSQKIPKQPKRGIKEYQGVSKQIARKNKAKIKTLLSHLVAKVVDAGPSAQSV